LAGIRGHPSVASLDDPSRTQFAEKIHAYTLLLAEVIALRTVLLNLMFRLGKGESVTTAGMQNLIERADSNKLEKPGSGWRRRGTARGKAARRQKLAPLNGRHHAGGGRR
jgi:hypothetical protein